MHARLLTMSLLTTAALTAQSIQPPFNTAFTAVDLGQVPGTGSYGGITFKHDDPNVLLFGAYGSGRIISVPVQRDAQGHIQGFGSYSVHATVGASTGVDGGLCYGPGNVLFHTWYGQNQLGQIKVGSSTDDRVIALSPLGIASSVGTCAFAPAWVGNAGHLKIASYGASTWYDVTLAADGNGTFSIANVGPAIQMFGGPEGILFVPPAVPMLGGKVLIAQWGGPGVVAYDLDANGDPLPNTGQVVLTGVSGNSGGAVDPVSGDLLFTGGGGHLVALHQGGSCGIIAAYGNGTPGLNGVPLLSGGGCARLGQTLTLQVGNGRPFAIGVVALGVFPTNVTVFGVQLLTSSNMTFTHLLDGAGATALQLPIPTNPHLGDTDLFFQAGYFDAAAPQGISATGGLSVHIL